MVSRLWLFIGIADSGVQGIFRIKRGSCFGHIVDEAVFIRFSPQPPEFCPEKALHLLSCPPLCWFRRMPFRAAQSTRVVV
ncbi:MAG: hypothetical protein FWG02_06070 [Holophagaceae bacterium]|nr:hypothetical protein [Holophagaceae bacterium]